VHNSITLRLALAAIAARYVSDHVSGFQKFRFGRSLISIQIPRGRCALFVLLPFLRMPAQIRDQQPQR